MASSKLRLDLSRNETELFITYYLGQEVLWNIHCKEYSRRDKRHAAVKMIQQQMQVNGKEMTGECGVSFHVCYLHYRNTPVFVYMHMSRAYNRMN